MKYTLSEKKALKKLGIPDFRHMTKDKIVSFTSMIHKMDPEVAKEAIKQFPEFKDLSLDIVNTYKSVIDKVVESNEKSQNVFYNTCNDIISSLKDELNRPELSSDERDRIEKKMIQAAKMIGDKDSENKKFHSKLLTIFTVLAATVAATAASTIGSNAKLSIDDEIEEDDDDSDYIDV